MRESSVYQEGEKARELGFGFNANPYDPTVEPAKYEEWLNGWGES